MSNFEFRKILILLVVGGISWILIKEIFTYLNYQKGKEAYQSGQCQEAIASFDQVINQTIFIDWDDYQAYSQALKSECVQFLEGVEQQKTGQPAAALLNYNNLIEHYPDSSLITAIRQQTATIFTETDSKVIMDLAYLRFFLISILLVL